MICVAFACFSVGRVVLYTVLMVCPSPKPGQNSRQKPGQKSGRGVACIKRRWRLTNDAQNIDDDHTLVGPSARTYHVFFFCLGAFLTYFCYNFPGVSLCFLFFPSRLLLFPYFS